MNPSPESRKISEVKITGRYASEPPLVDYHKSRFRDSVIDSLKLLPFNTSISCNNLDHSKTLGALSRQEQHEMEIDREQ